MNNNLVYRFTSRLNSFLSAASLSGFTPPEIAQIKQGATAISNTVISAIDEGRDLNYISQRLLSRAAAAANAAADRDELLFWRGQMCFLSSLSNVYKQYRAKNINSFYDSVLKGLENELKSADFFRFSTAKRVI